MEQPRDLHEEFMIGRFDLDDRYFHSANARAFHWPNRLPPELAVRLAACYAYMERLAADLMRQFVGALALARIPIMAR